MFGQVFVTKWKPRNPVAAFFFLKILKIQKFAEKNCKLPFWANWKFMKHTGKYRFFLSKFKKSEKYWWQQKQVLSQFRNEKRKCGTFLDNLLFQRLTCCFRCNYIHREAWILPSDKKFEWEKVRMWRIAAAVVEEWY